MPAKILKHKFQSAAADGADGTLVRPSNWNDDHDLWSGDRTVTITTDTLAATDNQSLITYNAGAVAVSLAAGFTRGWTARLRNIGAGVVTFTGTGGGTINGAASITLDPGWSLLLQSISATDYAAIKIPSATASATSITVGTTAINSGTTGRFLYDNAGALGEAVALRPDVTANITIGFTFTAYNAGTVSSGTFTPSATNGNYQYYTNNGAHTLGAPAVQSAIDVLITNGATAGAITFTGFTVGSNTGDPLTTTNGHKFIISMRVISTFATYTIKALQ